MSLPCLKEKPGHQAANTRSDGESVDESFVESLMVARGKKGMAKDFVCGVFFLGVVVVGHGALVRCSIG